MCTVYCEIRARSASIFYNGAPVVHANKILQDNRSDIKENNEMKCTAIILGAKRSKGLSQQLLLSLWSSRLLSISTGRIGN